MKRFILTSLLVLASISCYAVENEYTIMQTWDNGAFQIYYVAAGTETAAAVDVNTDSITLTVAGGFNPGSKSFVLTTSAYNTYLLFQSTLTTWAKTGSATVATDDVAMQGTWVVVLPDDVYEDTPMSALATTGTTAVLGIANIAQLTVDASSTTMYSRYIPADTWGGNQNKIKSVIANFTGTTPVISIYNNSDVLQYPQVTLVSGSPSYLGSLDNSPIVIGGGKERLEVRMTSTGAVTAGYIYITYIRDR